VVLAVGGRDARFPARRGVAVADLDFRAMLPVNVRTEDQREAGIAWPS
jgi:hypothetical protein